MVLKMENTKGQTGIIFAGTSEGSRLYEFCLARQINAIFCVATEYGKETLCKLNGLGSPNTESAENWHKMDRAQAETADTGLQATERVESICCSIRVGRMNRADMEAFFKEVQPAFVIDATHPYAIEVTENIRNAVENYRQECHIAGKLYYRVLRELGAGCDESEAKPKCEVTEICGKIKETAGSGGTMMSARSSFHQDMEQAVSYLQTTQGNIFATTGSKQIETLCKLNNYRERVYLRILPNVEMLQKCLQAGFLPSHIICMQGPFSQEMNELMLRQYDIKYLLTKQSGVQGGYPEKVRAACACGAELVVLAPPQESEGVSVEKMCSVLATIQSCADG
jgi:precorrin-6x reductase